MCAHIDEKHYLHSDHHAQATQQVNRTRAREPAARSPALRATPDVLRGHEPVGVQAPALIDPTIRGVDRGELSESGYESG